MDETPCTPASLRKTPLSHSSSCIAPTTSITGPSVSFSAVSDQLVTKGLLRELKSYQNPNKATQKLAAVLAALVLEREEFLDELTTWLEIRRCLSNVGFFHERLLSLEKIHAESPLRTSDIRLLESVKDFVGRHFTDGLSGLARELGPSLLRVVLWVQKRLEKLDTESTVSRSAGKASSSCRKGKKVIQSKGPGAPCVLDLGAPTDILTEESSVREEERLPSSSPSKTVQRKLSIELTPDIFSTHFEGDRSKVFNLTLSRAGVGKVVFGGTTDTSGISSYRELLKRVKLAPSEVVMYPRAGTKPAIGVEFNRPAEITLMNCKPKDVTREVLSQEQRLKYEEKVRKMTESKGAHFVSYDADEGMWQFKVEHF